MDYRSFCRQRLLAHAAFVGIRGYFDRGTIGSAAAHVIELLPWRESNKTLRQLLENIIFTKEVWTAALSGVDMDMNGAPKSQRSPQAMLQRLDKDRC